VRENELTVLVLLVLNVNLNLVAELQVGIVTEFRSGDDTIALVADVDHHFLLVDRDNSAFYNLVVLNLAHGTLVGLGLLFLAHAGACAILELIPVEVVQWLYVLDVV
jgi:hypothetical protein